MRRCDKRTMICGTLRCLEDSSALGWLLLANSCQRKPFNHASPPSPTPVPSSRLSCRLSRCPVSLCFPCTLPCTLLHTLCFVGSVQCVVYAGVGVGVSPRCFFPFGWWSDWSVYYVVCGFGSFLCSFVFCLGFCWIWVCVIPCVLFMRVLVCSVVGF